MKIYLLEDLLEEITIKTTKNNEYEVLTSSQSGIVRQKDYFKKQVASLDNTGYKIIKKGQFTYRAMSDTGMFYINRLDDIEIGIVSPAYPVFQIKSNEVLSDYLKLYFESYEFQNQIASLSTGSTRLALKFSKLKKLSITIPSLQEQKRIVKEITLIKQIIEKNEELVLKNEELIKCKFVDMFGSLDLSEPKSEWKLLGDLTKIYTGTTPLTSIDSYWGGGNLWITPAEIMDDSFYIYDTKRKLSDSGLKSKSLDIMPINTVLLSTRAPIGKVAIVGTPMACNQGFKNFYCNDNLNPIYLYILLKNNTEYLNSLGSGTTFREISKTVVSKIRIPCPDITKQKEYEDFVITSFKLKQQIELKTLKYKELLADKMQKYFC